MRPSYQKRIFFLLFSFLLMEVASGQNSFFKFKISEEGVYKLSASQAQKLGAASLSQIAVFGYPGMLPQLLQRENLELQEIPSLEKDGNLYFYLASPDSYEYTDDKIHFYPNQFSDSISFLIGFSQNPKRIQTLNGEPGEEKPAILYQWNWLKEAENNILNSGRAWYSRAVAPGITRGYAFPLTTSTTAEWKIAGKIMARASSSSKISWSADDLIVTETLFEGIPASTYSVKGEEKELNERFIPAGNKIDRLRISFQASNQNDAGYFEYLGIGVPHASDELDKGIYTLDERSSISLGQKAGLSIWEVSDFYGPKAINFSPEATFSVQKLVVFNENDTEEITQLQAANLSLRSQSSWPDLLIIAPKSFSKSAEKLSLHKIGIGIYTEVAYLEDIYEGFGYGNRDLSAIRNYIAWHFHQGAKLKNVLILGKGTFDYQGKLGGRPNLVPIYTSRNSLNPLTTFSSDDYFSLLEFGQGYWEESRAGDELMQIGVGRLPVINTQEARIVIDKIIDYENDPKPGDWKKTVTLFADDGDNNIHLRDSEAHSGFLARNHPQYKQQKFYLDRFEQEKTGDIQSSPQAKSALEEILQRGTLLLNYIGHGNATTLTAEEVFLTSDIPNWAKQEQLALWMTATCEFGRHDSPFIRSAAEELLIIPDKGAIGLLTTGRPVFSSVNFSLNEAFISEVFRMENGLSQDLGNIFKNTKNQSLNGSLNRNFSLLADPSMKLATTEFNIVFTSFTDPENQNSIDTLTALQEVSFEAEVQNSATGGVASSFTGTYRIELYDKPATSQTLGDESAAVKFQEESSLLFKGTGSITSGIIRGKMIVPKNINLEVDEGSVRILGEHKERNWEAYGLAKPLIGGVSENSPEDLDGPVITALFGGKGSAPYIFPTSSILMEAAFNDSSGINISGLLPAENLTVQINQDPPLRLNNYFEAENGTFTSGKVNFRLTGLNEGRNLVTIRAWDNLGNSSKLEQEIIVEGSDKFQILSYKTYPNPTQVESHFELEHNRPGENINLVLAVYQTDGKILFSESKRLVKADAHLEDLSWLFLQSQTKYPAKGTYIYKITLQSELDNSTDSVSGLIVIQ
ncbi:type IX secretion system sortase PorU [Algoriphagus sp.]|uniref:type IX secretion system sortase PorU n=1 Tax=Algoriphagus sp. TaxID=1872435 RepID=UPI0032993295